MKCLSITRSTTLSELSDLVGSRNVESVLVANRLTRTPNIGAAYQEQVSNIKAGDSAVSAQRKCTIINALVDDSDIFERAALADEDEWKVIAELHSFSNALNIPETIRVPDSERIIGNGEHVTNSVYKEVIKSIQNSDPVDPKIFAEYSARPYAVPSTLLLESNPDLYQNFAIPWGEVSLYSSLADDSIDFPVYPEQLQDGRSASYITMPDLLYQYEPWQLYESSGPRSVPFTFDFHRDMWTGDHRDGKANELIRFCQANCYAEFNGSAVNTALVTLYIHGSAVITGIMTEAKVSWDGPIGLDGWYLHCVLEISITEVSSQPLNYDEVRGMPLIG